MTGSIDMKSLAMNEITYHSLIYGSSFIEVCG